MAGKDGDDARLYLEKLAKLKGIQEKELEE
jgi:hypothetical protein